MAQPLSPEGTVSALAASLSANVDPASGVQDYQGEMQIMVDPNNPQHLVGGANSFYRDPSANCVSPTGGSGSTFGTQALYGSTDGGQTWTYRCAPWPATLTGGVTGAAAWFGSDPAMAWDAQGNAYAVYMLISQNSTGSSAAASIVIARSTDVGQTWTPLGTSDGVATWSSPTKVNDDVGAASQFFPWASVDQSDGSVNVSWYDTRVDPTNNRKSQLFYARSSNGGVSFEPNILVDDSGGTVRRNLINFSDENTADNSARNANQYGDYSGIAAANRQVYPFWMDSRQFFPSADTASPSRKEDAACSTVTTCSAPGSVAAPTVSSTCGAPGTLVSWSAPSGWGTNATSGTYSVYRSTANSFPGGAPLASGLTTTNYIDTTGALGTTYYYFVRATNNCPGTSLTPMTSDSAASSSIVFAATSGACGALRGNVSSAGSPVGGAVVDDGAISVSTDQNGFYQFVGIAPGTYNVSVSATGYVTASVNNVVVQSGGDTTQNFDLAPTSSANCPTDTTQTDFGAGVGTTLDLTSSPGDVTLSNAPSVDQQNTSGTTTGTGFGSTAWTGQTFIPAVTGQLVKADVQPFCSGCGATPPISHFQFATRAADCPPALTSPPRRSPAPPFQAARPFSLRPASARRQL